MSAPWTLLQFADSAKRVMTHARLNSALVPDRILVKRLQAEVDRLKRMLMTQTGGSGEASGAAMVSIVVMVWLVVAADNCCWIASLLVFHVAADHA